MKLRLAPSAALLAAASIVGCGADSNEDPYSGNTGYATATNGTNGNGSGGSSGGTEGASSTGGTTGGGGSSTGSTGDSGQSSGSANVAGDAGIDDGAEPAEPLELAFSPMYSAYDGVHIFKVPVRVVGTDETATFTASDPNMVDIEATRDGAMITTLAAGTVTISAAIGDRVGTSELFITDADPADYATGRSRYNNGVLAYDLSSTSFKPYSDSACTNCHGILAGNGDIEHTPQQTGGYSDEQLITLYTMGKKPEGVPQRLLSAFVWGNLHKWEMTEEEAKGIAVYLRSLEPKSQGELDFGGLFTGGGGGVSVGVGGSSGGGSGTDAGSQNDTSAEP